MLVSGKFFGCLGILVAALLVSAPGGARAQSRGAALEAPEESRSQDGQDHFLRLYNTHTGERMEIAYRRGDQYFAGALAKLDYFLRDHRTGDVRHFDPRLYDLLYDLTAALGDSGGEIDVICGYRTPFINEFLRSRT